MRRAIEAAFRKCRVLAARISWTGRQRRPASVSNVAWEPISGVYVYLLLSWSLHSVR
jgi:hypothetical protein